MTRSALVLVGPSTGGIGTHVADLVATLPEAGVDVTVIAHPVTADRFGLTTAAPWPDLRRAGSRAALATLADVAGRVDVVHAHGFQAGLVAALAARLQRRRRGRATPFVVSLHNQVRGPRLSPRRVVGSVVARRVLSAAALVTGASSDLVADARALGAPRAELAEVPSPRVPDLLRADRESWRSARRRDFLSGHGLDADRPVVLTLARVAPQKGLAVLAHARAAGQATAQWVLVGPGQEDAPADLARSGVHLAGAATDVTPWLLAADVLVVPSEWEARALVAQEAMAAGTPVVATDVGGLPDLLSGVGVLVAPLPRSTFAPRLAAAVDDLLAAPLRASRLADAARERAGSWDDSTGSARRWRDRYTSLAQ